MDGIAFNSGFAILDDFHHRWRARGAADTFHDAVSLIPKAFGVRQAGFGVFELVELDELPPGGARAESSRFCFPVDLDRQSAFVLGAGWVGNHSPQGVVAGSPLVIEQVESSGQAGSYRRANVLSANQVVGCLVQAALKTMLDDVGNRAVVGICRLEGLNLGACATGPLFEGCCVG